MSRYIQKRFLGSGTYSNVFLAEDTLTKEYVALKRIQINPSEGIPATTLREISLMKQLNHPNILKYIEASITNEEITIVFEYVEYTLLQYTTRLNCLSLIGQLIQGIFFIHKNKIMHRDIKPDNILVNKEGILKIADFNLARSNTFLAPKLASEVVTLWYRAPELLMNKNDYSYYIDIWAVGCVISEMCGTPPLFQGKDIESQLFIINDKIPILKEWLSKHIENKGLIKLIVKCLNYDYRNRPTAQECIGLYSEVINRHR